MKHFAGQTKYLHTVIVRKVSLLIGSKAFLLLSQIHTLLFTASFDYFHHYSHILLYRQLTIQFEHRTDKLFRITQKHLLITAFRHTAEFHLLMKHIAARHDTFSEPRFLPQSDPLHTDLRRRLQPESLFDMGKNLRIPIHRNTR